MSLFTAIVFDTKDHITSVKYNASVKICGSMYRIQFDFGCVDEIGRELLVSSSI